MTAVTRSARGASAFTRAVLCPTRPLDERGWLTSEFSNPPDRTWSELVDDLLVLRTLEEDWDGQGAVAPHPTLVDGAITLAQHFQLTGECPADRVIASVNGTIIFEWQGPSGYLEIEVTTPVEAEGRRVRAGSEATEEFLLLSRSS